MQARRLHHEPRVTAIARLSYIPTPPVTAPLPPRRRLSQRSARSGGRPAPGSPGIKRRRKSRPAQVSPEQVRTAFTGTVRPVRASIGYRVAALFAAVLLVVLPLVYLAVIAAAGWGVWWHFTQNDWLLSAGHGRIRVLAWMLYAAPGADRGGCHPLAAQAAGGRR